MTSQEEVADKEEQLWEHKEGIFLNKTGLVVSTEASAEVIREGQNFGVGSELMNNDDVDEYMVMMSTLQ